MKKMEVSDKKKGSAALKEQPTTLSAVVAVQIPPRTVRNIRHSHIPRGMRDIRHLGWRPWDRPIAESLRQRDRLALAHANRFYDALKRS